MIFKMAEIRRLKSVVPWICIGTVAGIFSGIAFASSNSGPWHRQAWVRVDERTIESSLSTATNLGGGTGRFELVEFLDYECPACRAIEAQVSVMSRMPSVHCSRVVAQLPLAMHPHAAQAAAAMMAAKVVGVDRILHAALMKGKSLDTEGTLESLAKTDARFTDVQRLMRDARFLDNAKVCLDEAMSAGFAGTPTFCVRTPRGNLLRFETLQAAMTYIHDAGVGYRLPWDP